MADEDARGDDTRGWFERVRDYLSEVGWARQITALAILLVALIVSAESWRLPIFRDVERTVYDLRATLSTPPGPIDERIYLAVYDPRALMQTDYRRPLDRKLLADALTNLDGMGVEAIGITLPIEQRSDSDEALLAALQRMRTPTFVAWLGSERTAADVDPEVTAYSRSVEKEFFARIGNPAVHKASIRLSVGSDNVVRAWPGPRAPGAPAPLAAAMAGMPPVFPDYAGSLRFKRPASEEQFGKVPIDLLTIAPIAANFAPTLKGKLVIIGEDVPFNSRYLMPQSGYLDGRTFPIPEVHAQMLRQALDSAHDAPVHPGWYWLLAAITIIGGFVTGLADAKGRLVAFLILVEVLFLWGLASLLMAAGIETLGFPTFGPTIGWILAFLAGSLLSRSIGSEQRSFAQGALGKYLPASVAAQIIRDPRKLSLSGEKREIYALFSDLEGFTKLTESIDPELTARLLNGYLSQLSTVVLSYGGTIDKFVGDAVVAFWGAPIGLPTDADNAAQCAHALWREGEKFRAQARIAEGIQFGRTRVGLHHGEAIVGNFGGDARIQYTALGDVMNTAARLESANKYLETGVLISGAVVERLSSANVRPLGRINVSGRKTPIAVYEPLLDGDKTAAVRLAELLAAFDAGEPGAVDLVAELAETRPDDTALRNLARRLATIGPGESYALDGK